MSAPKVIDSLTHSFDVMVSMLFRPFDFGKWCLLGLVFFLAGLTEDISNLVEIPFQFLEYFIEDLEPLFEDPVSLIMPGLMLIGGLMLLSFGMSIVTSIAHFAIYDNIKEENPGMSGRWGKNVSKGISFFLIKLCVGLIYTVVLGVFVFLAFLAIDFPFSDPTSFDPAILEESIVTILVFVLILTLTLIVMGFFSGAIYEFVPVIMYTRDCGAAAACRELMGLLFPNFLAFFLYMIMKSLVMFGGQIVMQIGMLVTCCLGALPYIRSTLFLPVLIVFYTYPVAFLGYLRPEYDSILHRFRGDVIPDIHEDFSEDSYDADASTEPVSDDSERYRKEWD